MLPIPNHRPTTTTTVASTAVLNDMPHLTSVAPVSAQPAAPSCDAAAMPDKTDIIRTLAQKIEQFNADEKTNLLVSIISQDKFDMSFFIDEFAKRRKAFDANEEAGFPHVNFSTSLLTPTLLAKLFWHKSSRLQKPESYDDWNSLVIPNNFTKHQDQLKALENNLNQLKSASNIRNTAELSEHIKKMEHELGQARLAVWQEHPEVLYRCQQLYMGYIVSDRALIQNAFPRAGNTANQRFMVSVGLSETHVLKILAYIKNINIPRLDKHAKIVGESIVRRGRDAILTALRKHIEKHDPEQISEVLIGAPDDDLTHVIDGFFLDMRSGFEKMNLETVNLYLYHNQDIVLKKMAQIRGFPLLVNYSDQDSGRHKFAYVTLNAEGVPVAMTQPPLEGLSRS